MTRLRRFLVLFAALSLALAACGGDDDDGDVAADVEGEVDADDIAEAVEDAGAFSAECAEAIAAYGAATSGAGAALSGDTDDLEESVEALEAFAEKAPDEIREDLSIVAAAVAEFVEIMADADYDPQSGEAPPQEVLEALEEYGAKFADDGEVAAAANRVNAWFEDNCDVDSGE